MFKIALKGILARKGRLLLTSLAVILGTSFLAGTFIFSDTLTKSFKDLFADVFDDTDAYVRSSVVIKGDFGQEERQRIPDSLTAEVAKVPGVKTAASSVLGFARVIGKDGKPVGKEGNGPPNFGSSITAAGEAFWKISDGRPILFRLTSGATWTHRAAAHCPRGFYRRGIRCWTSISSPAPGRPRWRAMPWPCCRSGTGC